MLTGLSKQIAANYFPYNILQPDTPYIYFNTLLQGTAIDKQIYNEVHPYFSKGISSLDNSDKAIEGAFTFLEHAIASERSKENRFLAYITQNTQKIHELSVPNLDEDWEPFVTEIQKNFGIGDKEGKNILNEFNRLRTTEERRIKQAKDESGRIYDDDQMARLTKFLDGLNHFIDENNNRQKIAPAIYNLILEKYGASLFSISGDKLTFNKAQILALTNTIATMVSSRYITDTFDEKSQRFDETRFKKILELEEVQNDIMAFLTKMQNMPMLADDLIQSLGLTEKEWQDDYFSETEIKALKNNIINGNKIVDKSYKLSKEFQKLYKNYKVPTSAFKISQTGNLMAEVMSVINAAFDKGTIYGINTGGAGAKPDNLFALMTLDLTQIDPSNENLIQEIKDIRAALEELNMSLGQKNDMDYYLKQQAKWDKTQQRIEKVLQQYTEITGKLARCFIIEDSTKNYISLYSGTWGGKVNDSLHGGSLGPNIRDQIAKLQSIAHLGGIDFLDVNWLLTAAINAGGNMIGNSNKNQIEEYLAAFATILLFDDQMNIAKETIQKIPPSQTTVDKIHLFSINNGYYPLSYVLKLTYDTLSQNYNQITGNLNMNSGVKVSISDFIKKPIEANEDMNGAEAWQATAQQALSKTKIKISFLVNFMGVLNKLLPNYQ